MKNLGFISSIFFIFALTSCSYTLSELGLYKDEKVAKISLAQMSEMDLNFETVKMLSLSTCLECHTTGNHSISTPEKLLEHQADVLDSVHNKTMPPKSSGYANLNECETKILETWIEDRTQNRSVVQKVKDIPACAGAKPPEAKPKTDFATLPLNYENLKREILAPKCLSCHATDSPGYQYALDDLERMKGNELILATADESLMYQVTVPGRVKYFMPPKKSGLHPLTAEESDYLKRWIEDGAKP
jgi:mono/diheme cytochrome c family protein